jgi:hypothetical protein
VYDEPILTTEGGNFFTHFKIIIAGEEWGHGFIPQGITEEDSEKELGFIAENYLKYKGPTPIHPSEIK